MHSSEFLWSETDKWSPSATHPLCSVHSPPFPPQWSNPASFPPQGHCEGSYSSATPGSKHVPCFSCLYKTQGAYFGQSHIKCWGLPWMDEPEVCMYLLKWLYSEKLNFISSSLDFSLAYYWHELIKNTSLWCFYEFSLVVERQQYGDWWATDIIPDMVMSRLRPSRTSICWNLRELMRG